MLATVVAVESCVAANWLTLTEPSALAWPLSREAASGEAKGASLLCFGDSLAKHGLLPEVLEDRLGMSSHNLALPASTAPAHYFLLRRALRAGARPRAVVVDYMPGMLTGTPPFGLPYWAGLVGPRDAVDLARSWPGGAFVSELAVRCLLPSFQSRWAVRESIVSAWRGKAARTVENNLMLRRNWRIHRGAQFTQDNLGWKGVPTQAEHDLHLSTRFWCHPVNRAYIHRFFALAESRGIRVYWLLPPVTPEIQRRRNESGADEKYTRFAREVVADHPGVTVLDARHSGYVHTRFVDSIHLTGKGALALSADVAEAIAAGDGPPLGGPPPVPRADAVRSRSRRWSSPASRSSAGRETLRLGTETAKSTPRACCPAPRHSLLNRKPAGDDGEGYPAAAPPPPARPVTCLPKSRSPDLPAGVHPMRMRTLLAAIAAVAPAAATADEFRAKSLEVWPAEVRLSGPSASQRLVVVGVDRDGTRRDLTPAAKIEPATPAVVAIDARGRIVPRGDGAGAVVAKAGGAPRPRVPVVVRGSSDPRKRVSFRHEVEPALTKLGCNTGACHGSQHGKGGFKLSLLGFESPPDFTAIVKSAESRRVTPFAPEESLLLLKPTLAVAHGGGRKLETGSDEYDLIRLWLEQGAPGPDAAEPEVDGLRVYPPARVMRPGEEQRLVAVAHLGDGTERDVTDRAKFDSLGEGIATVNGRGVVKIDRQGETNVMVRYQGHAALARLTAPFSASKPFAYAAKNVIDEKAAAKWRELGLAPSGPCTDAEFLRRVMLDAIGTTPTPEEVEAFLADKAADKRDRLVDRVLDRPEYVDFWALKWGDLLRVNSEKLGAQGMLAFNLWLRESFRANRPFDRMIDDLVTAQGSIYTNGPANYYRVSKSPDDLAETTAQVFMGVRLQCAKCHHHPFESYGQDDYYGLAAYFARVRSKNSDEFGLFGQERVVFVSKTGEVNQPRSGKRMAPRPLGAAPADDPIDRRRALAQWLTGPKNPWLAKNIVNRYWGYLMGAGLVDPIDDLRETNPPSNPELLDALAGRFVESGHDIKSLLKLIMKSRTYGLSALPTPDNRLDSTFFSHYPVKRLGAEQLLDALDAATGTSEKFAQRPSGTRSISLPDTTFKSYFLDTFGRPVRALSCECERGSDPNLSQALHLLNGDVVNRKINAADGRLAALLKDRAIDDAALVRRLYLLAFARPPEPHEVEVAAGLIAEAGDRARGAQDLFWGLLNSKEFVFNH